jgi:hypothetical protein
VVSRPTIVSIFLEVLPRRRFGRPPVLPQMIALPLSLPIESLPQMIAELHAFESVQTMSVLPQMIALFQTSCEPQMMADPQAG